MSLETNLQLNNELIAENNSLLSTLIQSLNLGTPKEKIKGPQTTTKALVEATEQNLSHESKDKDNVQAAESSTPDIESLDIRTIATLADLFGEKAKELSAEQLTKARAVENGNKRNTFAQALSLALLECETVKNAPRAVILELCIVMLTHWSAMETIDQRQAFAEQYIKTPYNKRTGLIPKKATPEPKTETIEQATAELFNQARTLIMKLSATGMRNEAAAILEQFGAQKLGQVPQDKLAEVVKLAEQQLSEG